MIPGKSAALALPHEHRNLRPFDDACAWISQNGNMARRRAVLHGFMASLTSIQVGDHTLLRMQEGRNTVTYTCFSRQSLARVSPFWDAIPRPNCLQQLLFQAAILWDGCFIPFPSVTAT